MADERLYPGRLAQFERFVDSAEPVERSAIRRERALFTIAVSHPFAR